MCFEMVNSHHPIGEKNFQRRSFLFGGGYIESENGFETLEYYRMKVVNVGILLYFRYIFRFFSKYFLKKNLFWEMFKYT